MRAAAAAKPLEAIFELWRCHPNFVLAESLPTESRITKNQSKGLFFLCFFDDRNEKADPLSALPSIKTQGGRRLGDCSLRSKRTEPKKEVANC